jgi:hypothetical protein
MLVLHSVEATALQGVDEDKYYLETSLHYPLSTVAPPLTGGENNTKQSDRSFEDESTTLRRAILAARMMLSLIQDILVSPWKEICRDTGNFISVRGPVKAR